MFGKKHYRVNNRPLIADFVETTGSRKHIFLSLTNVLPFGVHNGSEYF